LKEWLWIISPVLKAAILKLVKSHSSIHIRKSIMCVSPPFRPFINRYKDFEKELQGKNEKAWNSLNFFLREQMSTYLWERSRALDRGGLVSYVELWNVFKPDDDVVVVDTLGNKEIHVLVAIRQESEMRRQYRKSRKINLVLWGLGWDPIKHQVERRSWTIDIDPYEGDREILSLPIYPLCFMKSEQEEKTLVAGLHIRGIRWRELMRHETGTHHYRGMAFTLNKDGDFVAKFVCYTNFYLRIVGPRLT
jgi:hypothetical protein